MLTLGPSRWLNDSIINFVGKVLIQPWRGRGAARVHVFSTHLMNTLLSGTDSADGYNFTEAARWCARVPGGMRDLEEIFIPINSGSNHWNFIRIRVQEKQVELWDSLGLRPSNEKYLLAAERFIKDTIAREQAADRGVTSQGRQEGW